MEEEAQEGGGGQDREQGVKTYADNRKAKKEVRIEAQKKRQQVRKLKGTLSWLLPTIVLIALVVWLFTLPQKPLGAVVPGPPHIHADLSISIHGEEVEIPASIGLGGLQRVIHTHEVNDVLHIETLDGAPLREADTTLARFFEIWGKDFSADSILGNINGEGGVITMFVNGEQNFEYEQYQMRDGDIIEIIYNDSSPEESIDIPTPLDEVSDAGE